MTRVFLIGLLIWCAAMVLVCRRLRRYAANNRSLREYERAAYDAYRRAR